MLGFLYVGAHLVLLVHWSRLPRAFRLALLPWLAQAAGTTWFGPANRAYWRDIWWPLEYVALAGAVAVTVELVRSETAHLAELPRMLSRFSLLAAGFVFTVAAGLALSPAPDAYRAFLAQRAVLQAALALVGALMLGLDAEGVLAGPGAYRRSVCGLLLVTGLTSGWITVPQWEWIHAAHRTAFILAAVAVTFARSPEPRQLQNPPLE